MLRGVLLWRLRTCEKGGKRRCTGFFFFLQSGAELGRRPVECPCHSDGSTVHTLHTSLRTWQRMHKIQCDG
jgi:hypothetical protein